MKVYNLSNGGNWYAGDTVTFDVYEWHVALIDANPDGGYTAFFAQGGGLYYSYSSEYMLWENTDVPPVNADGDSVVGTDDWDYEILDSDFYWTKYRFTLVLPSSLPVGDHYIKYVDETWIECVG